jgi:LAS superfamily LD-carboxypeptidase LdcB
MSEIFGAAYSCHRDTRYSDGMSSGYETGIKPGAMTLTQQLPVQRKVSPDVGDVGKNHPTGIKPGAVTLTQQLPVQRKAGPEAGAAPTPMKNHGVIRAYGGDVKAKGSARSADDKPTPQMAAETGTSGSGGPLPHLDRIQRLFGKHDVSSVRAYTDGNAAAGAKAMGAEAFAVGDQVGFGTTPSLHTAAHEAAHVVQQRAGVALKDGVGQVGDSYERHADAVADKVVRGESAESLLDQMAGTGGGRGGKAVQRLASTEATEEGADEAPLTAESPEATIAAAIDTGHDPDRSSGPIDAHGAEATHGDAAESTQPPAGAALVQKKAVASGETPQAQNPHRAIQRKATTTAAAGKPDARSIVKQYVVEKDAARVVPDVGSDVYKASQDLSRATCGSDGDPPGMVDIGSGRKLHQDVKVPLANMLAAAAATGKKDAVKIKDALRSLPQQWDIWKRLGLYGLNGGNAAIPGTSNHGTGRAVDLSGDLSWVAQHAGEHGFVNFSGEDWHFDHLSSAGVRGRKFKEGASRKRSGQATSDITKEEAEKLQASYDAAIKSWDEGKTPGSTGTPVASTGGTTAAPTTPTATTTATTPTATTTATTPTATTATATPATPPATATATTPTATATPATTAAAATVDPLNARLTQLVGTSVTDNGGFTFVLEGDLSFKVTGAPPAHTKVIGKLIKREDPKLAKSWQALSAKLQQEHPAPASASASTAPQPAASGGPLDSIFGALTKVVNAAIETIGRR